MFKNVVKFLQNIKPKEILTSVFRETKLPNGTVFKEGKKANGLADSFTRVVTPGEGSFLTSIGVKQLRVDIGKTPNNMAMHGNKPYNEVKNITLVGNSGQYKTFYKLQDAREFMQTARTAQASGFKVGL
ncbi:hypothetical protein IJ750_02440 [bacterium]|nr:hypothetical protein [bacterium]